MNKNQVTAVHSVAQSVVQTVVQTIVQSIKLSQFPVLALILAGFLSLAFPLAGQAEQAEQAEEDGYRLLELEGYKVKWGGRQLGVGARISYAFAGATLRFDEARNCRDLAPIATLLNGNLTMAMLANETAAAFRVWERAAGLSFHAVDDPGEADIILGAQGQPNGRAFANVSYAPEPDRDVRAIEQALVCLNPEHKWKIGFDGDNNVYDLRYTLIHEIGHAIGLDHPGPSGQVMAFRYTEAFDDLQPGDLRGVQLLYGRPAGEGEPANDFNAQVAQEPGANAQDVTINDPDSYLDSSTASVIVESSPGMDDETVDQSRDSVELALDTE